MYDNKTLEKYAVKIQKEESHYTRESQVLKAMKYAKLSGFPRLRESGILKPKGLFNDPLYYQVMTLCGSDVFSAATAYKNKQFLKMGNAKLPECYVAAFSLQILGVL